MTSTKILSIVRVRIVVGKWKGTNIKLSKADLLASCSTKISALNLTHYTLLVEETTPGLMIMASHQIFSGQLWHLTDQTKFDQTNLLYIIDEEVHTFTIGKQMSGQLMDGWMCRLLIIGLP